MNNSLFKSFSSNNIFVIDKAFSKSDYTEIDLSASNENLNKINVNAPKEMAEYINDFTKSKNAKIAIGGYLETRNLYKRSRYFNEQKDPSDERNIHLGVDIWAKTGTKVLTALDGKIHSFKNNTNHGDYGPCIILKHQLEESVFYTLYGHLSLDSIKDIKIGQSVKQGDEIAQLGDSSVNGDYAPHLHFQIIKDLQDNFGDYPGVSSLNQLNFYKENCPNPLVLLGVY
jgi:murein DD-endopeptidase MepM/ murein hydrolase activator NlpD